MSQGDQDKTEQPTPHHLEEARKRGEVAKSPDVTGVVVMIAFASIVVLSGTSFAQALARATSGGIELAGVTRGLDRAFVGDWSRVYAPVWQALLPLVLGLLVAGLAGNLLQTGPMVTTQPLKPDFKRMHPMQALRRIFSFRTIWELGKLAIKSAFLVSVCVLFAWKARALVESVLATPPALIGKVLMAAFAKASLYVLLVLALVAVADMLFSRREYMRKMRMSRREVRDEIKRRDGDPTVKTKQKQLLRELLKKTRALGRVAEADVIITNPTHVAVALRYRPGETLAPVVIAKGAGMLSGQIRRRAFRHSVPIVRSPALARALYKECEIDQMIPQSRYQALVPIYRELWASLQGGKGG